MERDHLKGASVDAINVSQGGRIQSPARAGLAQALLCLDSGCGDRRAGRSTSQPTASIRPGLSGNRILHGRLAGVSNVIHRTGIPRNALHPVNVTVPDADVTAPYEAAIRDRSGQRP